MAKKAEDPGREIALMALAPMRIYEADALEDVLTYCWEQLLWRRSYAELVDLRASLSLEDEPEASPDGVSARKGAGL